MGEGIEVEIDDRHAITWPQVRESLGLNPAGPDEVDGVKVVSVEESEDGYSTNAVTLRFADADALQNASIRLFNQAEKMFEYGIHDDAGDVQDFASYALPSAHEVIPDE